MSRSLIATLVERRAALIEANEALVARAAAEQRDELNHNEQSTFDATNGEIEVLNGRLADLRAAEARNEVAAALAVATGEAGRVEQLDAGEDPWQAVHSLVAARSTGEVVVARDATLIGGHNDYRVWTRPVPGDYPAGAVRMLGLFDQQRADGPVQRVYRVSAIAQAGATTEGEAKTDAELALDPVDVTMVKLTSVQKVTDELRADWPTFANMVPGELLRGLAAAENAYALGVLDNVLGSESLDDLIDDTAEAIASIEATTGRTPDAIVVSPADLATVRQAKAEDSGVYHVNPIAAGPSTLHGVRLVVNPALEPGVAYVGSFATAGIAFTRQPATVQVGMSGDDFVENKTTVRVETRVGLGLIRPGHIIRLDINAS